MMSTDADAEFVPARAPAVYTVEIDHESVLLDRRDGRLHLLNPTAALVWTIVDGEASVAELASELADGFGISSTTALADLAAVVADLDAAGLLVDARAANIEGGR